MIDHVWTVICSRAVIDKESNNFSLQNVLEKVTIYGAPSPRTQIPESFDIVTTWIRSDPGMPCRGAMRLTFVLPSGEIFGSVMELNIELTQNERYRQKIHFQGLPAAEAGRHIARVELQNEGESEWRQVAAIPLEIDFQPPEEEQPNAS